MPDYVYFVNNRTKLDLIGCNITSMERKVSERQRHTFPTCCSDLSYKCIRRCQASNE